MSEHKSVPVTTSRTIVEPADFASREAEMETLTHPAAVVRTYGQALKETSADARYVEIDGGHKIHVIETGMGPPLVILHGTGAAAFTYVPIVEHLEGVHAIIPDLPGNGLSDPVDIGSKDYRSWGVTVMDQILDALGVDQISLAGASGGGLWAIWYALARPERVQRLILLTGIPLLPGTHAPLPMRIITVPIIGDIIDRIPTNERMVLQFMGMMGEKETIVNYPWMIEALAASMNDPVASRASRSEFSALLNLLGWRTNMKIGTEDLATLGMPTLMIWGEHDPLGGADVARAVCETIPNCKLELLPAGHVPWLGYPEKTARLISDFVRSGENT